MGQFDCAFLPSVKCEQIESLHELGFLNRRENVGKTHLAISLAVAAAEFGRRVYYGTLAGLIESLMDAKAAGELSRRLRVLTHPVLLVVDEIGYLPVTQDGAVLGDEIMAAALIDGLLHGCHLVNIRGNSYQMREHQNLMRFASEQRHEEAVLRWPWPARRSWVRPRTPGRYAASVRARTQERNQPEGGCPATLPIDGFRKMALLPAISAHAAM